MNILKDSLSIERKQQVETDRFCKDINFQNNLSAFILSGGKGMRLKKILASRPKIIALVNKKPFLYYIFDQLLTSGFDSVTLCTGYNAYQIVEVIGNKYKELSIFYSHETNPLDTGGAIANAINNKTSKWMIIFNGDSYIDINLNKFIYWHFKNELNASLIVTKVDNATRFGRVYLDSNSRVLKFTEKNNSLEPGWINAGVYIFKRETVKTFFSGLPFSIENDFLPYLTKCGLNAFRTRSEFIDIGTPDSYAHASTFFSGKNKL